MSSVDKGASGGLEALLAELVVGTSGSSIGAGVRVCAVRQAFDCVGVLISALSEQAGEKIVKVTQDAAGRGQARVVGSRVRTSATDAAWANASLAHLLDFDDTGFSHPTACLLPAALAAAELASATGRDAVTALVIGYEVFERLSAMGRAQEPQFRRRGVHPTSIWGAPAAAAVASRLLGLNERQVTVALGIAATGAAGLTQQFGSWGKGLNAGNAARVGVHAALLARVDFQADRHGLSGPYGLMDAVVGPDNWDASGVDDELGTRWSILKPGLSIKPYPTCTSNLRAIDATLRILAEAQCAASEVSRIVVDLHPDLLHTLRFRAPTHGFSGKFSLDYVVASAALDGDVTHASFTDEAAGRPALRDMLSRVVVREHPEWPVSRRSETPVAIWLADGRVFHESVPHHWGSRAWPLTDEEVVAKFVVEASRTLPREQVERSVGPLLSMDDAENVGDLLDFVTPPGPEA